MHGHRVVSREAWEAERKELLAREKQLTRLRDQVTKERQAPPWVKVEKQYVFDGPDGRETLADLFAGRSQLVVYHFMFQPDWSEGCKSCSFIADHYEPSIVHLQQRDTTMVTISRAELGKLQAFRKRMGWNFKWMSSLNTDFNQDFHVSFPGAEDGKTPVEYNYQTFESFLSSEGPGLSVFFKDEDGYIYHTYSCFSRGLEDLIVAYDLLDRVPKGRNEEGLLYAMEWVRHHDRYGDDGYRDIYVELITARKGEGDR